VIVQFSRPNPLINLRILGNRNFGLSSISSVGMGRLVRFDLSVAAVSGADPELQRPADRRIMWMGVPQLFLIPLVPKLMKYVSPKWLCALGFGLFGLASFSSGVLNPDFAGPQFNQIRSCARWASH
jgi:DHA2 family multidrug resistance protein